MWVNIKECIISAAEETCERVERTRRNRWFNDVCEAAVKNRKNARLAMLQDRNNHVVVKAYRTANISCKREIKRAKRRQMMERMERINASNDMGRAKSFFGEVKHERKGKSEAAIGVHDKEGRLVMEEEAVLRRWCDYFSDILNRDSPNKIVERLEGIRRLEGDITPPTLNEVKQCRGNEEWEGGGGGHDHIRAFEVWR